MNSLCQLSRKPGRPLLALLLFISILLLGAQTATLAHGAEHPFHHHTELCDSLLAFQHSTALLACLALMLPAATRASRPPFRSTQPSAFTPARCSIRAPPVSITAY